MVSPPHICGLGSRSAPFRPARSRRVQPPMADVIGREASISAEQLPAAGFLLIFPFFFLIFSNFSSLFNSPLFFFLFPSHDFPALLFLFLFLVSVLASLPLPSLPRVTVIERACSRLPDASITTPHTIFPLNTTARRNSLTPCPSATA